MLTSCCLAGKVGSSIAMISGEDFLTPAVVYAFLSALGALFRSRLSMRVENVALRHQLAIYQRTVKRPRVRPTDRMFCSWLSRRWTGWRQALVVIQPATVIAWQQKRFRDHWVRMIRGGKPQAGLRLARRSASSFGRSPARIRCGGLRAASASWESWGSTWRSQRWTSTVSDRRVVKILIGSFSLPLRIPIASGRRGSAVNSWSH